MAYVPCLVSVLAADLTRDEDRDDNVCVRPVQVRSIRIAADTSSSAADRRPFRARSYRIAGDVLSIVIVGRLDAFIAPQLGTELPPLLDPAKISTHVEIDLHGLTFCNTCALGALHGAVAAFQTAGAQVTAVGPGGSLAGCLRSPPNTAGASPVRCSLPRP